jgi:hypothetical protein
VSPYETEQPPWAPTDTRRADDEQAATIAPPLISPAAMYYTPRACQAVASDLDDPVLLRALTVFRLIQPGEAVKESDIAHALELPATQLWGTVTNPLKRRADELGLPLPYRVVSRGQRPAHWVDLGGVADRMIEALKHELDMRLGQGVMEAEPELGGDSTPNGEDATHARYAPLGAALAKRSREREVAWSLEEIESTLGFELPAKAWADPTWWADNPNLAYRRHIATWLELGWTAYPNLASQRVAFRRPAGWVAPPEAQTVPARQAPPPPDPSARSDRSGGKIGRFARSLLNGAGGGGADCGEYTPHVCAEFAVGLGDAVLERSCTLFDALADGRGVASEDVAGLIGTDTSRLGGQLATPLRRRAKMLELETPYEIELIEPDGRRVWRAASGAGVYLAGALRDELARRR